MNGGVRVSGVAGDSNTDEPIAGDRGGGDADVDDPGTDALVVGAPTVGALVARASRRSSSIAAAHKIRLAPKEFPTAVTGRPRPCARHAESTRRVAFAM
jgi:hypothetical protein